MKHIFIINPAAGKKRQETLIENIKRVFKDTDYFIEYTSKAKDASEIALRYAKSGIEMIIYACGGDGTLHEVVNGIVGYKNVRLGIIPIGTGNDFVKSLSSRYKKEDFLHLENYLTPVFEPCDVMDVEGEYSLNTTSIGFDVRVAAGVEKYKSIPFASNSVPYVLSLVGSFVRDMGFEMNVVLDGKAQGKQLYSFVVACNGKYYGGGFLPCPDASLNDGYIDVCLINKIKHIQVPQLIGKYKNGTHTGIKELVSMHRVKKMQIIAKEPIEVCVDGEIVTHLNPVIEIVPSAITLCLPKAKE